MPRSGGHPGSRGACQGQGVQPQSPEGEAEPSGCGSGWEGEDCGGGAPAPHGGSWDFAWSTSSSKASSFRVSLGRLPPLPQLESHSLEGTRVGQAQFPLLSESVLRLPTGGRRLPSGFLSAGSYFLAPNILLIKKKKEAESFLFSECK